MALGVDTLSLIAHVTSDEHKQLMADQGFLQHTHSWFWVNAQGAPVDEGYPNAIRYVKPGCPLCERQERSRA